MDTILKTDIPIMPIRYIQTNAISCRKDIPQTSIHKLVGLGAHDITNRLQYLRTTYGERVHYFHDLLRFTIPSASMPITDIDTELWEIIFEYGLIPTTIDAFISLYIYIHERKTHSPIRTTIKTHRDMFTYTADTPQWKRKDRYFTGTLNGTLKNGTHLMVADLVDIPDPYMINTCIRRNLLADGNIVFKCNRIETDIYAKWISILTCLFDNLHIYKPITSDPLDNTIYIIGREYIGYTLSPTILDTIQIGHTTDIYRPIMQRIQLFNIYYYQMQKKYCNSLEKMCRGINITDLSKFGTIKQYNIQEYMTKYALPCNTVTSIIEKPTEISDASPDIDN